MPRKGYKAITVKDDLFAKLQERARKKNLSIPKLLAFLIGDVVYSEPITSFEEFAKTF